MSLEQKINYQLNKHPTIKKKVKFAYQHAMYAISPGEQFKENIIRISPDDPKHEYFFGYYDKSPWDKSDRYMLCMKAADTWSDVSPHESAEIILIDTEKEMSDPEREKKIAETRTWNVQQSCMLQWLGPDYSSRILFNDYRNGKYVSVILTLQTGEEKVIDAPVYSVSADGIFALTLDFSRLYNLRPGYGYYNVKESTEGIALPDTTAIWKVSLVSGEISPLLKYTDFAYFQPRPEMQEMNSVHKVNHIMLSPNGKRFMVLYRWFVGERKYSRLITCNTDGTDMYVLSDDDMVSHCFWKNNSSIIAFENKKKTGTGYYLMKDRTGTYVHLWPELTDDGHPSFSPDGKKIVTDSYPDRARIATIKIMDADIKKKDIKIVAKVFAPFKYDNDTRCDLHPRWNRGSNKICFDGVFEGHRGLYVIDLEAKHKVLSGNKNSEEHKGMVSCVIPTYKRCDTVTRAIDSVLAQTYTNIEVIVVDDNVSGDEYSLALQNVLKKYDGDSRVRYIQQKIHKNGAVARNEGIKAAHGQFIAFLDDDDEWLPEKLERQMEIIMNDAALDAVTCLWTCYKEGKEYRRCKPYTTDNLQFKVFMREVAIFIPTVVIRKKAVLKYGGFDEELLRHQDLQFLIDAMKESEFAVLNRYLVKVHTDSEINMPDVENMIRNKAAFFESVDCEFNKYSKTEKRRIRNAHYYEIVFRALKSRDIKTVAKYMLKAGIHPASVKDLIKRFRER